MIRLVRFQACFHKLQELPEALGCAFLNHQCDHRLEPVAHVDHHYHLQVAIVEPEVASLSPIHRSLRGRDILSHNITPDGEILVFGATVRCSLRNCFRRPWGFELPRRSHSACAP